MAQPQREGAPHATKNGAAQPALLGIWVEAIERRHHDGPELQMTSRTTVDPFVMIMVLGEAAQVSFPLPKEGECPTMG